jgi:D-serine deaminase-like pyridoxal phosphate-dependent protein
VCKLKDRGFSDFYNFRIVVIIDKKKCLQNIEKMAKKASRNNVIFRPHFKTHNVLEVGEWFRDVGIDKITVSSVSMARKFYNSGWKDITVAFPFNIREIDHFNEMAANASINLVLFSRETLKFLISKISHQTGIFIKIDTGMHRTGVLAEDTHIIDTLVDDINKSGKLFLKGFLTHAGHTYRAGSPEEVKQINQEAVQKLSILKTRYSGLNKNMISSVGDTPSCSIADDFSDVDEIRPGNFIYYDSMQHNIGSCSFDDISACVACPVVGKDTIRKEVFIYGGAVHLSKDFLTSESGFSYYGLIVFFGEDRWSEPLKNTYIARISQEHGIIKTTDEYFDKFNVGDLIGVIPIHSCLAANALLDDYSVI